jgi:hypothetical protein
MTILHEEPPELVNRPSELASWFGALRAAVEDGNIESDDAARHEELVLDAIEAHLKANPHEASSLLPVALLPRCLTVGDLDWERRRRDRARERLREFIDDLPPRARAETVHELAPPLLAALGDERVEPACWTCLAIGERDDRLIRALREVMIGEGSARDLALRVLAGLGPRPAERTLLLASAQERARLGFSSLVADILHALADPSSVALLAEVWLKPGEPVDAWRYPSTFRVLAAIAASRREDGQLQDEIWQLIWTAAVRENQLGVVLLGSNLFDSIASDLIIPDLARWLVRDRLEEGKWRHAHYLATLRMFDCVHPRQLDGWRHVDSDMLANALRADALADTGNQTWGQTPESMGKEAVWDLLLRAGCEEALRWIDDSLGTETSDFVQAHVLDMVACLRVRPLPLVVQGLITERNAVARGENPSRIWPVLAAVKVAWGEESDAAFQALLHCGLSVDGDGLQTVGVALADVSARQNDRERTLRALYDTLTLENPTHLRQSAAVGLLALASREPLRGGVLEAVSTAALSEKRGDFERGTLIAALGPSWSMLRFKVRSQIEDWATASPHHTRRQALSVLADSGVLDRRTELLKVIGLVENAEGWRLRPGTESGFTEAAIVGALYRRNPSHFGGAVCDILLLDRDWSAAQQASAVIRQAAESDTQPTQPTPAVLVALRTRMIQSDWRRGGDSSAIFDYAAVDPAGFISAWREMDFRRWSPVARRWLAEAAGRMRLPLGAEEEGMRQSLLAELMLDADSRVREGAYSALVRDGSAEFDRRVRTWMGQDLPEHRLRAAEASAWLRGDEVGRDLTTALSLDVDGRVRRAAREALLRRERREWANVSLNAVLSAPSDQVLRAWPYGQALVETGEEDHLAELSRAAGNEQLPQHKRIWLGLLAERLEKELKKRERTKTSNFRLPHRARVVSGQGQLWTHGGEPVRVSYVLWMIAPGVRGELGEWGGSAHFMEESSRGHAIFESGAALLELQDGSRVPIRPNDFGERSLGLTGTGAFPAAV